MLRKKQSILSSLKALLSRHNFAARVVPSHLFALNGAWSYSPGYRIHSASPPSGIMTKSRLPWVGATSVQLRISIDLFPPQHVEGGFGQMPRHCSNRFGMSFALTYPLIQPTDVPFRMTALIHRHRVGRFRKGPFQIPVHVHAQRSVTHFPSAGVHARRGSRVAGQVHGARKALHLSDLQCDCRRQNHAHSRQRQQPLHFRRDFHQLLQPLFQLLHLCTHKIQLRQQLPAHPARLLWQTLQMLFQFRASALAVRIAVFARGRSILGQRCRKTILQPRALRHQHQPRAGQLAQVAQRPRRNPYRRQRAVPLQTIQSLRIQLVGLVRQSHHQFRLARMHQSRLHPSLLDLIDNPIPVPGGFHGHGGSWFTTAQILSYGARSMLQSIATVFSARVVLPLHPGVVLMRIKRDIFTHARLLSLKGSHRQRIAVGRSRAFIFSFRAKRGISLWFKRRKREIPRRAARLGMTNILVFRNRFSPSPLILFQPMCKPDRLKSLCGNSLIFPVLRLFLRGFLPVVRVCAANRVPAGSARAYTAPTSAGTLRHRRIRFNAVFASVNSIATLASPRIRNRRIPCCSFKVPILGSTISFRLRQIARPAGERSFRLIRCCAGSRAAPCARTPLPRFNSCARCESGTYASIPRSSIPCTFSCVKNPLSALTCCGRSPHSCSTRSTIGTSSLLSAPD